MINRLPFALRVALQKCTLFHRTCATFVRETRVITQHDVDRFSEVSGDHNPIHKSGHPADRRCIHGAFLNAIISGIIGTKMPGPGCVVLSQEFTFPSKCVVDEEIKMCIRLVEQRKIMKVEYTCKQCDKVVFEGTARLIKTNV